MKTAFVIVVASTLLLLCCSSVIAQSCLTGDDITTMLSRLNSPQPTKPNTKIRDVLIKLTHASQELLREYVYKDGEKNSLRKRLIEQQQKNSAELCQILKEFGWPTVALVGKDGVLSAYYLLETGAPLELQRDLLPVLVAALKQDQDQRPAFAALIDRLRVNAGMKQLFGTQAFFANGFLVLYPIEEEAHVDARRRQFRLPPMSENLRTLESRYQTTVVKSRDVPSSQLSRGLQQSLTGAINSTVLDTPSISEDDVIRVNTNLVNLNVSVFSNQSKTFVSELTQNDFKVFEDGHEETVSFFASTDVPFDLVLLLDLSGSTAHKRDVIRQSTRRFIEAARPSDRIAIVTFSDKVNVLSPLTANRTQLLSSSQDISGDGGSHIWDALKFALDTVVGPRTLERRRAVVMMTDGADNSFANFGGAVGSQITFADLLEAVRKTDTLVVPIYLDTESDGSSSAWTRKLYENARKALALLADESGGSYYKAKKITDLNGVYDQVINDLGKVYSLGYKPTNDKRDSTWRSVRISIVNRPDLTTRSRPGYYAR